MPDYLIAALLLLALLGAGYLSACAGVTAQTKLSKSFSPGIPASGQNVAIVLSAPALGAGNTQSRVEARGHRF